MFSQLQYSQKRYGQDLRNVAVFFHCWFHLQKPREQKWTFVALVNPEISCHGFDTIAAQDKEEAPCPAAVFCCQGKQPFAEIGVH